MIKVFFYLLAYCARVLQKFRFKSMSRSLYQRALEIKGLTFSGPSRYIDFNVYLDPTAGISIGKDIVISTRVIIMTHDYSYTTGLAALGARPDTDVAYIKSVTIGDNVFIGAGSIILPGSDIGSNVIIGAGSVVRGKVESNSVVAGNPAKFLANINSWAKHKQETVRSMDLLVDKR